jgi:hypothetical protein
MLVFYAVRGEGDNGQRRKQILVKCSRFDHRLRARWSYAIGSDGLRHMLEVALAKILNVCVQICGEAVAYIRRYDDLAGACQSEDSGCTAHPSPIKISMIDDDIADLDSHPEHDLLIRRKPRALVATCVLN